MRTCKGCGSEIPKKGKVICKNCGSVNKKPFFHRTWVIVTIALIVLGAAGSMSSKIEEETAIPKYVTVDQMYDDLNDNPLQASKDYKGIYVTVSGKVGNIDSDGNYFILKKITPDNEFIDLQDIMCFIDKDFEDQVSKFEKGQFIKVTGKVTSVGEALGYNIDVTKIKED